MKRLLLELVLVLGLGASGYFGWTQWNTVKATTGQVKTLTDEAETTKTKVEEAEKAQTEQAETIKTLQPKAQQFDAAQGALADGQILDDLEKLYAKQKGLSSERQLGLGVIRLLTKGAPDSASIEALNKALEQVDWKNKQKIICAAQNALAAAGQDVKVLAECNTPPPLSAPGAPAAPAAAPEGKEPDAKKDKSGHGKQAAHWEYEGSLGPENWGKDFPTCAKGKAQAPLNITGPFERVQTTLAVDYKAGALSLLNNGHTIQVQGGPDSKLRVDSKPYPLVQFHFHRPSEEQIDGKPMAMTIHFVHKNDAGELMVLGVLIKEGNENPGIKTLWDNMPEKEGSVMAPDGVRFNPANLLPRERDFWSYEGSLTTPPCSEKVRFFILKTPINMSREQIAQFPFKLNARPVQPLNGRTIQTN